MRGNVATRLGKLAAGEADATLLAAAGLNRLGQSVDGAALDASQWLPAAGQGAIAVECRSNDTAMRGWLAGIDHADSRRAVLAERALLAALGGNCHSPVAMLTHIDGETLTLRALLFSPDGQERIEHSMACQQDDAAHAAALAGELLRRAPPAVRQHFGGA